MSEMNERDLVEAALCSTEPQKNTISPFEEEFATPTGPGSGEPTPPGSKPFPETFLDELDVQPAPESQPPQPSTSGESQPSIPQSNSDETLWAECEREIIQERVEVKRRMRAVQDFQSSHPNFTDNEINSAAICAYINKHRLPFTPQTLNEAYEQCIQNGLLCDYAPNSIPQGYDVTPAYIPDRPAGSQVPVPQPAPAAPKAPEKPVLSGLPDRQAPVPTTTADDELTTKLQTLPLEEARRLLIGEMYRRAYAQGDPNAVHDQAMLELRRRYRPSEF